jgi:hypothetical protein
VVDQTSIAQIQPVDPIGLRRFRQMTASRLYRLPQQPVSFLTRLSNRIESNLTYECMLPSSRQSRPDNRQGSFRVHSPNRCVKSNSPPTSAAAKGAARARDEFDQTDCSEGDVRHNFAPDFRRTVPDDMAVVLRHFCEI